MPAGETEVPTTTAAACAGNEPRSCPHHAAPDPEEPLHHSTGLYNSLFTHTSSRLDVSSIYSIVTVCMRVRSLPPMTLHPSSYTYYGLQYILFSSSQLCHLIMQTLSYTKLFIGMELTNYPKKVSVK